MLRIYYKQENEMDDTPLRYIQKAFLSKIDSLEPKYGANGKLRFCRINYKNGYFWRARMPVL